MDTATTMAGIPYCRINTDDPLIAHWAVDRISDLRKLDKAAALEAARALFDEATIRSLLTTRTHGNVLPSILRELPDDTLCQHISVIAETWQELSPSSACNAARLLVRHRPDRALELFLEVLDDPRRHQECFYAVLEAAFDLPESELQQFVAAIVANMFRDGATPPFSRISSFLVARLAWKAEHPRSLDVIRTIADAMPEQDLDMLETGLAFLAEMLTGTAAPLSIVQEYFNEYEIPAFAEIPLFFPDNVLALQLDEVVPKLADMDYRAALALYERHKSRLPQRVTEALDLCRDRWLALPDLDELEETADLFALFPACIAASMWVGKPKPPAGDTEAILSFLCTNLETIDLDNAIVGHFSTLEKSRAIACLTERLEKHRNDYGALRMAELMGRLGYREFIPTLIDNLNSDFSELCDTITTALARYGEEAACDIVEALETSPEGRYYHLLDLLMRTGGEPAATYLEEHFDELARRDKETLASAIETFPERRFIERLAPLAGKGQFPLDHAYLVLNRLHGFASAELTSLEEEYREYVAEQSEWWADCGYDNLRDELNLEMECSACGDISRYDVESVYIGQTEEVPFVGDELTCISCGADDTLDLTSEGVMAVTAEVVRLVSIRDKEFRAKVSERSPIHMTPRFTAMGKEMGIREAFDLYRKRIAEDPTNGEHRLGFGNILKFIGRFDKAHACFKEAVRLEPRLIEAHFHLAQLDVRAGDYRRAFLALHEGILHLPQTLLPHLEAGKRIEFINAYVSLYNGLKTTLSIPAPAISHHMFGASVKTGRNDPCPCGSGKKYKKCCGN